LAVLATDEIRDHYPALSDACAAGAIAGGIEVVGFTVNVHTFMARLIDRLETQGVQFRWSQRFTRLERNSAGMVTGAVTDAGVQRADHYVICPGAYGRGLLAGTRSAHKVHGVLGCWLTVPNVPPRLENSIKIARRGFVAEDTNVTVAKNAAGEDVMIFGSGYGYTGENPANVSGAQLEALYLAVEDTVRRYFPKSFASAGGAMPTRQTRRFCVRPWTSSCLGIFEVIPARGGIAVVVGGHNTGGFAQGPSVAEAVVAAVAGRYHPMHASYDPDRLERFRRIDTGLSSW
jgi:D-amino-acid dehydrogenase